MAGESHTYQSKDNAHLGVKLALRTYFLEKYHADGQARVLDCCQGDGHISRALRSSHQIAGYWGLDVKPKPGRIKADSSRILLLDNLPYDVFDADTYGSPWDHWIAILEKAIMPATVFLTSGRVGAYTHMSATERELMGFPKWVNIPNTICGRLRPMLRDIMLTLPEHYGKHAAEIIEAKPQGAAHFNASYYGVRLVAQ